MPSRDWLVVLNPLEPLSLSGVPVKRQPQKAKTAGSSLAVSTTANFRSRSPLFQHLFAGKLQHVAPANNPNSAR